MTIHFPVIVIPYQAKGHGFTGRAGSCQSLVLLFPSWPSPWFKVYFKDADATETASLMLHVYQTDADAGCRGTVGSEQLFKNGV